MVKTLSTITEVLSLMADEAKRNRRPEPVITTDLYSALILRNAISNELPGFSPVVRVADGDGTVAMFDGVTIAVARKPKPDNGFREHFGVLAEIYA